MPETTTTLLTSYIPRQKKKPKVKKEYKCFTDTVWLWTVECKAQPNAVMAVREAEAAWPVDMNAECLLS